MRKSCIIGHSLCVALMVGVLGLGTALADDKGGAPNGNANANDNANGNAGDDSDGNNSCVGLPDWSALEVALDAATTTEASGLNNQMWAPPLWTGTAWCAPWRFPAQIVAPSGPAAA